MIHRLHTIKKTFRSTPQKKQKGLYAVLLDDKYTCEGYYNEYGVEKGSNLLFRCVMCVKIQLRTCFAYI